MVMPIISQNWNSNNDGELMLLDKIVFAGSFLGCVSLFAWPLNLASVCVFRSGEKNANCQLFAFSRLVDSFKWKG